MSKPKRIARVHARPSGSRAVAFGSPDVRGSGAPAIGTFARPVALLAVAVAMLLALLAAPAAQARQSLGLSATYDFSGQFGAGGPGKMAIDQSAHLLYVVDPANNRILKFDISDPTHPVPASFAALGSNEITEAEGAPLVLAAGSELAVDNSGGPQDGTIYLATDTATNSRADAFAASGKWLYVFAHNANEEFSPTGTVQPAQGIAVAEKGPRAGEIFRLGTSTLNTSTYTPSATPEAPPTVRVAQVPASFPAGLAGGIGTGYTNGGERILTAGAGFLGLQTGYFSSDNLKSLGAYNFGSWGTPFDFATAPGGTVLVRKSADGGEIARFLQTGSAKSFPPPATTGTEMVERFAFGSQGSGNGMAESTAGYLYGTDSANGQVNIYRPVTAPDAEMTETGFVDLSTAELRAKVNPLGLTIESCEFEWGTTDGYGSKEPCETLPSGNESVTVTAKVPVTATTKYHTRVVLVAANNTRTYSDDLEWLAPALPEAETLPAGPQQRSGTAVLGGMVDANKTPTAYYIEYSTDPGLANPQRYPAVNASAGEGESPQRVYQVVPGLTNHTTYYFRLVAVTKAGTDRGAIESFKTFAQPSVPQPTSCPNEQFRTGQSALLPDCRAWEQVSPPDKDGGQIGTGAIVASPDGDRVAYRATSVFAGATSLGVQTEYVAQREDDGWSSQGIAPPPADTLQTAAYDILDYAHTPDLSYAEGAAYNVDLPGAPRTGSAAYLWDIHTGRNVLIAAGGPESSGREIPASAFLADDGQSGAFNAGPISVDSGPELPSGSRGAYWWKQAGGAMDVELASILPSGGVATGSAAAIQALSSDGEKLLWITMQSSADRPGSVELYISRRHGQTEWVSKARGVAEPTATEAVVQGWSRDLRYVYYSSEQKLTADATAALGAADLYRFDTATEQLEDLTTQDPAGGGVGSGVLGKGGILNLSADGRDIYFLANGNLAAGASGTGLKLYGLRNGDLRFITDYPGPLSDGYTFVTNGAFQASDRLSRVSGNGRYLLFPFQGDPTGTRLASVSPTNGHQVLYRYDWDENRIDCVSCDPTGGGVTADAYLVMPLRVRQSGKSGPERYFMSDQGEVLFNTAQSLLPQDTNGKFDAYLWNGDLRLLTNGSAEFNQAAEAATPGLTNIYVLSGQQLVPADTDGATDVYDARVDGGLASQQVRPSSAGPGCEGSGCQGLGTPPPAAARLDTERSAGEAAAAPEGEKCANKRATVKRRGKAVRKHRAAVRRAHRAVRKAKRRYKAAPSARLHHQVVKQQRRLRRERAKVKKLRKHERRAKAALRRCQGGGSAKGKAQTRLRSGHRHAPGILRRHEGGRS